MKKLTIIIAALISALMLVACSSGGRVVYEEAEQTAGTGVTGSSWTVLVYMCGGSEETENACATEKLDSLMSVDYPENVKVVVQTGGSSEWHKKGVYCDYTQRFEVGRDTMYLADQSLSANMGDYKTLADFLSWGVSKYKADNYMLVLSGAGGGCVNGMAFDEQNENDSLNMEEISYALSLSGKSFDIIAFDSSLMCGLETAAALSTCGDYMVASQEFESGCGLDYAGFIGAICENPSAQKLDICKSICDTYYAACEKKGTAADATMSVLDMSKVSTLQQAFDGMAGDMLTTTDSLANFALVSRAADEVVRYGGATADEGFSNMLDLGDLAVKMSEYVGNTADLLVTALNDAVEYRVCGERKTGASGLSVFYPLSTDSDELQKYMEVSRSEKYKEYLKKICVDCSVTDETVTEDYNSSWAWNDFNNDMQWMEFKTILDGNTYGLDILGNMSILKDVSVNVYKKNAKTGEFLYLGKTPVSIDWQSGLFREEFSGKMPRLYGKMVTMRVVGKGSDEKLGDYEIVSIPVILNGKRSNIRALRICTDNGSFKYEILGAWDGLDDTGKAGTGMRSIGVFDRIAPLYAVYDETYAQQNYTAGAAWIKMFGSITDNNNVENGEYMLEYEMTDIYGQKRHGTTVTGTVNAGGISYNREQ